MSRNLHNSRCKIFTPRTRDIRQLGDVEKFQLLPGGENISNEIIFWTISINLSAVIYRKTFFYRINSLI